MASPEEILEVLRSVLRERGRAWREVRGGVAIEYDDGCDAMFLTADADRDWAEPRKAMEAGAAAKEIAEKFERLNRVRRQTLVGLRHWAAERKATLHPNTGGKWGVELAGGCYTEVAAGAELTRLAETQRPAEALIETTRWLDPPTEDQAKLWTAVEAAPGPHGPAPGPAKPVLDSNAWLGMDCGALDDPSLAGKPDELLSKLLTGRREAESTRLAQELAKQLGRQFGLEFGKCNAPFFEFDDKLDSFRAPAGKLHVRALVRCAGGIEAAAAELASRFKHLNAERSQAIKGVLAITAARGYRRAERGLSETWWFGKERREHAFEPERSLTRRLKSADAAGVILEWLRGWRDFGPLPAREEIFRAIEGPEIEPERHALPGALPGHEPTLPPLSAYDLAAVDRLAADLIARKLRRIWDGADGPRFAADGLYWWGNPLWYRRGVDRWTTEEWWMQLARKVWKAENSDYAAAMLLLNGDREPLEWARTRLRELDCYHYEAFADELIWMLKDELPWPMDDEDWPAFPRVMGPPPVHIARRDAGYVRDYLQKRVQDASAAWAPYAALESFAKLHPVSALEWLAREELDAVRSICQRWSKSEEDIWISRSVEPLAAAAVFGWPEIVDILEQNKTFVLAALDEDEIIPDPGGVAQRLTLIAPGEFAARFAALGMTMKHPASIAEAAKALGEDHGKRFGAAQGASFTANVGEGWSKQFEDQRIAAAIAWLRCRDAGVGGSS